MVCNWTIWYPVSAAVSGMGWFSSEQGYSSGTNLGGIHKHLHAFLMSAGSLAVLMCSQPPSLSSLSGSRHMTPFA